MNCYMVYDMVVKHSGGICKIIYLSKGSSVTMYKYCKKFVLSKRLTPFGVPFICIVGLLILMH